MIDIACDACGKRYRIDEAKMKTETAKVKCKTCGRVITVSRPQPAGEPPPAVAFDLPPEPAAAAPDPPPSAAAPPAPADGPVIDAGSGHPSPERPEPAAPTAAEGAGPEPDPVAPAASPTAPAAEPASTGGLPTRDELTVAWGDSILASLPPRAKAFFSAGRFMEVTDRAAVFGLPNAVHMQKCENGRPDVEKALAAHFGRPVPLKLAVDDDAPPVAAPPARGARPPAPVPDESDIDPNELTDADVSTSSVDRVRELFPGAELVDPT